jgi:hypothetical protein
MIEAIFAVFGIAALLVFRFVAPALAVPITCLAGWLLLPVGNYPEGSASVSFPYWITGAAVPSDMLLTKMWWPPAIALMGALWMDHQTLARWRPSWTDLPMLLWCLWPMVQWPFLPNSEPQPWISSLYLAAAWGTPWLLGRVYFAGSSGGKRLITAIVAGLAVIVPIAVVEFIRGPLVYSWFYDLHPFRFDGAQRYIGFRPIAFFEHGNQYGIWVATTSLAAISLWRTAFSPGMRVSAIAVIAVAIALMSQSVGAILLLFGGLFLWWTTGRRLARWVLPLFLIVAAFGGTIYLSGVVPLRAIAENTVIGRQIVNIVHSSGRGSFTWRIARDQDALTVIKFHPVLGTGQWDWWRRMGARPWGLDLLIAGQFGLVGLMLAFSSILMPAFRVIAVNNWAPPAGRPPLAVPLAVIALMAIADTIFNSFFFYPAILIAGALGTPCPDARAALSTTVVSGPTERT